MPPNILYAGNPAQWPVYRETLKAALDELGVPAAISTECADPATVDYVVFSPGGPVRDFSPFTRLKAVLSLWAGVESFQDNPSLVAPLARMVDPALSEGMAEWVLGHCLRYHLGMDAHILGQDGVWRNDVSPALARDRRVGILGLGELGRFTAHALKSAGFRVSGWSRRQKNLDGVTCFSGVDGLDRMLAQTEILVLLLPATTETNDILNVKTLAMLPAGAFLLNPGRGTLIDDDALLDALGSGRIAHATLDVFRVEPLPADHPYWAHPNVTVTPHIASETRAKSASRTIAENVRRGEAGEALLYLVDRKAGY